MSLRRSKRLSINKAATPISAATEITRTSTEKFSTAHRRHDVWRQQVKTITDDSDDDLILLSDSDEERNENCNIINKMSGKKGKSTKTNKSTYGKRKIGPMPASKKRELAEKLQLNISDLDKDEEDEVDEQNESPPKQSRQQHSEMISQQIISPSRLIARLSIDGRRNDNPIEDKNEKNEQESNQAETSSSSPAKTIPKRNKYQKARKVLNSAETENLPGRQKQLEELRQFFTEHLDSQRSGSLYVSGKPGTGKTACLSLLLHSTEFSKRLQSVYVNCTSIASVGAVYKKLCAEFQIQPAGRTERDYVVAIQKYLRHASRMVLIVLDEIDQLCSNRQSVLYTIFEWPGLPGVRLLLVGIANSLDLTDRALTRLNARSELKPQLMHFPPYTKEQIVEILRTRLAEADVLDVFPPVTLELLAAKVSSVNGDVRCALDIGRRVVEIAEEQKRSGQLKINLEEFYNLVNDSESTEQEESLKPVQITQISAVLKKVYGASQSLQDDIEGSFPLQQKLMLCSMMLVLRNERNKDITVGRLHEVYRRVCTKRNIHTLDQAEFSGLIDLIETRGIVRLIRKKESRMSKVVLQWDEEEVNDALKDKQLIASILDDTSCLTKN